MAEANKKQQALFFDANVKAVGRLPNDMIRATRSLEHLNRMFEENCKMAHNSCVAFSTQSAGKKEDDADAWTATADLCLENLKQMRQCEEDMMMFQDEKIAMLEANIESLESYILRITDDLEQFQALLQPNMIKLAFTGRKFK